MVKGPEGAGKGGEGGGLFLIRHSARGRARGARGGEGQGSSQGGGEAYRVVLLILYNSGWRRGGTGRGGRARHVRDR